MAELLLHPTTAYQLEAIAQAKPHAVLISGQAGAGKQTLGLSLAAKALEVTDPLMHPYFLSIAPEKQAISIAEIRKLKDFLGKKTTGQGILRRAVLITDAHTMSIEAQNALLKMLEEPPADTILILTANDITGLKPTIRSRAQQLHTLPVSLDQATRYFSGHGLGAVSVQKAFYLSNGQPGLLAALLHDETEHPLVGAIEQAKNLLKASKYERLLKVDELAKQKDQLETVLAGLQRVVGGGLAQATVANDKTQAKRFYNLSTVVQAAQKQLALNVNPKLLLTNLFLNF